MEDKTKEDPYKKFMRIAKEINLGQRVREAARLKDGKVNK